MILFKKDFGDKQTMSQKPLNILNMHSILHKINVDMEQN